MKLEALLILCFSASFGFGQGLIVNPFLFGGAASSTLNTGLAAYWKIDEASGSRADSGADGQTLTDNNTVTSATGIIGNAGQFVSANTEYLSRADSAIISTGDIDYTISAWAYLDSETNDMSLVAKRVVSGNQREYRLYYQVSSARFAFTISSDGTALGTTTVVANNFGYVTTNTWYNVVAMHNATANTISIAVNNGTANSEAHTTGFDSTAMFSIGADNPTGTPMNPFNGRIDEVALWKKILSAGELTELYNGGAGKTCCPF